MSDIRFMSQQASIQYSRPEQGSRTLRPSSVVRTSCTNCRLGDLCLGCNLENPTLLALERAVKPSAVIQSGTVLFREGEAFGTLYAVRSGFVKTTTFGPDGSEQVLGFHLPGDILGFDAIHSGHYHVTATTLGSSSVCAVAFNTLSELAAGDAALQQRMFSLLSRDITAYMGRLGDATADQRIAGFLLELSRRFKERGFSARSFVLAMPRRDIGNYLRLATETVSRVLTRFQNDGLIEVTRREVRLLDLERLQALL